MINKDLLGGEGESALDNTSNSTDCFKLSPALWDIAPYGTKGPAWATYTQNDLGQVLNLSQPQFTCCLNGDHNNFFTKLFWE